MSTLLFFLGLFFGSFLAVLGWRLPLGKSVTWDRSRCDSCGRVLAWYELIPVISYVLQKARCRTCRARLSLLYPLAEIACGLGLALLYQALGPTVVFLCASVALCAGIVLWVSDALYQLLPDGPMSVFGIAVVGYIVLSPALAGSIGFRLLTALFASGFFASLWAITKGRGMGFGDVKLAFILGFLLGYPEIVIAVYAAFLTGAGVGVILMMRSKLKLKSKIAFGPFLFVGAIVALVWSNEILQWWRGLFV